MRPQKYKNYLHTIVMLFIFMIFFFRAARLPAVAVGLSALLASLVLAPIPAACGGVPIDRGWRRWRRGSVAVAAKQRNGVGNIINVNTLNFWQLRKV